MEEVDSITKTRLVSSSAAETQMLADKTGFSGFMLGDHMIMFVFAADSGLLSGGPYQSGGPDSSHGQRVAGQWERDPSGSAHLLQERDSAAAVGSSPTTTHQT